MIERIDMNRLKKKLKKTNELQKCMQRIYGTQNPWKRLGKKEFSDAAELEGYINKNIVDYFDMCGFFYKNGNVNEKEMYEAANQLTKAIFEDICIKNETDQSWDKIQYKYEESTSEIRKKLKNTCEKGGKSIWKADPSHEISPYTTAIKKIIKCVSLTDSVDDLSSEDISFDLSSYASHYTAEKTLEPEMKIGFNFYTEYIHPELYRSIYPVFCLVLLDANRRNDVLTQDDYFENNLIYPLTKRKNLEKYIFSLLTDKRPKKHRYGQSIFCVIRDAMLRNFKDKDCLFIYEEKQIKHDLECYDIAKKCIENRILNESFDTRSKKQCLRCIKSLRELHKEAEKKLTGKTQLKRPKTGKKSNESNWIFEMDKLEDRKYFVAVLREEFLDESRSKNSRNKNKDVLKNNLTILKGIIEISQKCGMPAPHPALFLYSLNKLTGWLEYYIYVNIKNANNTEYAYSQLDRDDQLAFSYFWKKYFKDKVVGAIGLLQYCVDQIYENISEHNKELIQSQNCDYQIYKELYNELFEGGSELYTGNTMDVLNYYYDKYIRDWDEYNYSLQNSTIEDLKKIFEESAEKVLKIAFDKHNPEIMDPVKPLIDVYKQLDDLSHME